MKIMNNKPKAEYKHLDEVINEIVSHLGYENEFLKNKISENWTEIVGEKLSKNLIITNYSNGILFLNCNSSAWRSELILRKDKIIKSINEKLRTNKIRNIIIK